MGIHVAFLDLCRNGLLTRTVKCLYLQLFHGANQLSHIFLRVFNTKHMINYK